MKTARCPWCRHLRIVVDAGSKKRPPRIRTHPDPALPDADQPLVACPGSRAVVRRLDLADLPTGPGWGR